MKTRFELFVCLTLAVFYSLLCYEHPARAVDLSAPSFGTMSTAAGKLRATKPGDVLELRFNGASVSKTGKTVTVDVPISIATSQSPGIVKIGTGLSIAQDGTLNNTGVAGVASFNNRGGAVIPSANDYSIGQIAGAAAVASTGSYADLSNKPLLSPVATSGSYLDLSNKPTIPAAQVSSDWSSNTAPTQILNKPTIPSALSQLTQDATHRTVTDAEKSAWNSNSSPVQSVFGRTGNITKQPGDYTAVDVGADPLGSSTSVQVNLDNHAARTDNPHAVTKSQVALGNVDNTSDANKPVSTAQAIALGLKLDKTVFAPYTSNARLTKTEAAATYYNKTEIDASALKNHARTGAITAEVDATYSLYGSATVTLPAVPTDGFAHIILFTAGYKTPLTDAAIGFSGTTFYVDGAAKTSHTMSTVAGSSLAFTNISGAWHGSSKATAAQGAKADTAANRVFDLANYASLQAAVDAATAAGGGTVLNARGATINISSTFVPKNSVIVDLNGGTLKWTGASSGVMVENDSTSYGVKFSGLINGSIDWGTAATVFKFHSIRSSRYGNLILVAGSTTAEFMHLYADATLTDPNDAATSGPYNQFGPFWSDKNGGGGVPIFDRGITLEGRNVSGAWYPVTMNNFVGPITLFYKTVGMDFKQYCDSNTVEGLVSLTSTTNDGNGICVQLNGSATPTADVGVWGTQFTGKLSCETWYTGTSGKKGIVLNKSGATVITALSNDRVLPDYWGSNLIVDNNSDGHQITEIRGNPDNKVIQHVKGALKVEGAGNGITFPDATVQTTAATGAAAKKGVSGTGSNVASVSGTLTAGKQLTYDASGNVIVSAYDVGSGMTYPGAGVPQSTGSAWGTSLGVITTVGSPGVNTNIPTEKAVRDAIAASSSGLADPGSNGIVKRTSLNTTSVAASSDVVALFGSGSCSGYLKSDGTCATPAAGGGNVTGPASSTAGHVATFADGTGQLLADGGALVTTPSGSDHQIQYNNAGTMAGAVNSYVDASTGRITIGSTTAPSTSAVKISSTSTTDADGLTIGRTSPTLNNAATNFTIANISAAFADNSPVANSVALGVNLQPQYSGSGSLNTLRGLFITPRNIGTTGTTGTLEGVAVWPRNTSTGTVGYYMNSFHAITPTNAGTVTGVSTRGLLIDNQGLAGSASSYGIKIEDQSGATTNYAIQTGAGLISFGGLVSAPAATWTQGTSTTIDTAATTGATISSSGATALTITNVVAGRYFDFKVTSSGGGAISISTLTPTWVTGTPASITATKSSWFVCKGTGANTADCAAIKENF